MLLHPIHHFILSTLHLTYYFIPYVTSSYTSLLSTGHFILYVTSYHDSLSIIHSIQQVTTSQSTLHVLYYFFTSSHRPGIHGPNKIEKPRTNSDQDQIFSEIHGPTRTRTKYSQKILDQLGPGPEFISNL